MAQLIGTAPNQVPTNGDLGSAAYMDSSAFYGTGVTSSFRNMIINGDMRIAQRGTSQALASGQSGYYTVDRFGHQNGGYIGGINLTYSQVADAPQGFDYSAKMAVGATPHTGSFSATSYAGWYQVIEGYDSQRLGWGSTNAKPLTISFWVKSSVPGNYPHVGVRYDSVSGTASSFFNFTINAANTWEYKTVTLPASPYALTNKTNGGGIQIHINTLAGVASAGTPSSTGAWVLGNYLGTQAQVNSAAWIGVANATFQITGVQAEVGTQATAFEYRAYQQELAMCQRYFQKSYATPTAVATNTNAGYHVISMGGINSNYYQTGLRWKVSMRDVPTVTIYNPAGTSGVFYNTDTAGSVTLSSITDVSSEGIGFLYSSATASVASQRYAFHYTAASEL